VLNPTSPNQRGGLQSPSGAVTSLGYHNYSIARDTNLRLRQVLSTMLTTNQSKTKAFRERSLSPVKHRRSSEERPQHYRVQEN
jgi:hypothetical protein